MYKVHLSIGDYEFVEVETPTPAMARHAYNEIKAAFYKVDGCTQKEWNRILDKYLEGEGISEEDHAVLGEKQRWFLHELDKADARRDNKQEK